VSPSPASVALLGPQRRRPLVRAAARELGCAGSFALVTAGWEERDGEDEELVEHLAAPATNLRLWHRGEEVFQRDPELFAALRGRFDRVRRLHELYRLRLEHLSTAARTLLRTEGEEALLEPERAAAFEDLRRLDTHYLGRVTEVDAQFEAEWGDRQRTATERHHDEIRGILDGVDALCIAGGHVGILLSRMRLLGLLDLWQDRPIIAWSAGAMVLAERVILFHDDPPSGESHAAEVFQPGFAVCPDIVPLPSGRARLDLEDPVRVARFARRFGPALCVSLDEGSGVILEGGAPGVSYRAWPEASRLSTAGRMEGVA